MAAETETWKNVIGFENYYEVSDRGRVRSKDRIVLYRTGRRVFVKGRILRQIPSHGYCRVNLRVAGVKTRRALVHMLVLESFVGPCPPGMQCRHFPDPDRTNNHLANLSWGTPEANQADRHAQGTAPNGEAYHGHKLTNAQAGEIKARLAAGEGVRKLGREYGVTHQTIGHIKAGRTWRNIASVP